MLYKNNNNKHKLNKNIFLYFYLKQQQIYYLYHV